MNVGTWNESRAGGPWPQLSGNAAHVWCVQLRPGETDLQRCRRTLSSEENDRASRFRAAEHQMRYTVTRALLRAFIARYLSIDAAAVEFAYNAHGKPELARPGKPPLRFNISHSHDIAVFAFTHAAAVGVDVERIRDDMPRRDEIASRYFSPGEAAQLSALPEADRTNGFFRCWTRKEAFVKARGDGIFAGLQRFEVSLSAGDARLLGSDDDGAAPSNWCLLPLPTLDGYAGAIAVNTREVRLQCWRACIDAIVQ